MTDNYHRHETFKKSRCYKSDSVITKHKKRKHSKDSKRDKECRTPPLKSKDKDTVSDLLKRRESIRQELKNYEIQSKSATKNEKNNKKHKTSNELNKTQSRRHLRVNLNTHGKIYRELSPELENYSYVDSEDEESIIEQRRKRRRELLEKLNMPQLEECGDRSKVVIENKKKVTTTDTNHATTATQTLTDMFSEKDDFVPNNNSNNTRGDDENNMQLKDNWDDSEGYYIIRSGDIVNNRYTIKDILGQGVFANVVRAQDNIDKNNWVAIKIVRSNDLMYKTGLKEVSTLKVIAESDPENKYHCVKLLQHFMHKNHLCMVLESLHMDLRCVLKKYGRHHGLNMKATMSYTRQLLLALRLLKKIGIIHADIKPDNILVNEKKNILKICDFGSATKVNDYEPTPYLVSRFYRAPEIILGIPYQHGVDIWSAACTIYEMATGKILFTGNSNNKMLKCFMDLKGKIPSKMIRNGIFKDQHFNYNNSFLLHKKDELTERERVVEISNIVPTRHLQKELKKYAVNLSEEKKILQLHDLLEKMLMLDSKQRLSVSDCLKHSFIQEELSN